MSRDLRWNVNGPKNIIESVVSRETEYILNFNSRYLTHFSRENEGYGNTPLLRKIFEGIRQFCVIKLY